MRKGAAAVAKRKADFEPLPETAWYRIASDTARATLGGMRLRIEDSRIHRMSCDRLNANELKWLCDLRIDEGIRTAAGLFLLLKKGFVTLRSVSAIPARILLQTCSCSAPITLACFLWPCISHNVIYFKAL